MRWYLSLVCISLCTLALAGCGKPLPQAMLDLNSADTVELISLDPNVKPGAKGPEYLQEYKILGTLKISDAAQRKKVVAAVTKSIQESDGSVVECFNPRHAVRFSKAGTGHELVLCFECMRANYFVARNPRGTLPLSKSGETELDQILSEAKVTLAPKGK